MPVFSVSLNISEADSFKDLLKNEECVFSPAPYAIFCAKSKNWQITFYKTGKVVVQGREIDGIIRKYFDKNYSSPQPNSLTENISGEIAPYPHIGTDESGKGDFFGPLVIAGCFLNEENAGILKDKGVMDSKKLNDKKIIELEKLIKAKSVFDIVVIGCKKYNKLYSKFKNLNRLLAWGHAIVIENILNKTFSKYAVLDKFADEKFVLSALKEKGKQIELIQRIKAESDTAVACASILARGAFVKKMFLLSKEYEIDFPKGASSNVLKQGENFIQKFGTGELPNVCKTHFKTFEDIINHQSKLF